MAEPVDEFHLVFGRGSESRRETFARFAAECIYDSNARELVLSILAVVAALTQLTSHRGIMALSDVTVKLINRMIMFAAKAATSQMDDLGVYIASYLSSAVADKEVVGGSEAFRGFLDSFSGYVGDIVTAALNKVESIMGAEAYAAFYDAVYGDNQHLAESAKADLQAAGHRRKKRNRR